MDNFAGYKFVALVNKNLEPGVALNALGHIALGLGTRLATADQAGHFLDFTDADGESHPSVSGLPLIVLRGTSGDIRGLRAQAASRGMLSVDFVNTMTGGPWEEEMSRTMETAEAELDYYGILIYGRAEELTPLTRKFSLYR